MSAPAELLPDGMTCRDCREYAYCRVALDRKGGDRECHFSPSRFVLSALARTAPEPEQTDG